MGARPAPALPWKRDVAMEGPSYTFLRAPSQKLSHLHPLEMSLQTPGRPNVQAGALSHAAGHVDFAVCPRGGLRPLRPGSHSSEPRDPSARTQLCPCAPRNVGLSEQSALRVHQPRFTRHLLCVGPGQGAGPQFTPFFEAIIPLRADLSIGRCGLQRREAVW